MHAVRDPATLDVATRVPDSAAADARAALDAAQAAFPAWRDRTGRERAQLLKRWNDLIVANQEDPARIISTEQGKLLAEARGEVLYGASSERLETGIVGINEGALAAGATPFGGVQGIGLRPRRVAPRPGRLPARQVPVPGRPAIGPMR